MLARVSCEISVYFDKAGQMRLFLFKIPKFGNLFDGIWLGGRGAQKMTKFGNFEQKMRPNLAQLVKINTVSQGPGARLGRGAKRLLPGLDCPSSVNP